jgi:RNA polymerase sigma-70 factor, ECF subfamily
MAQRETDFTELYRRHSADVFRFALHLCGNRADAEDLTSETFVRAWTTSSMIAGATVRAYLFTIARRLWLRNASAARHVELTEHLPDRGATAPAVVEYHETIDAVERRLAVLPAIDRTAFRMRVDGASYEEIAAVLGLTEGTARVKIHRARAMLAGIR